MKQIMIVDDEVDVLEELAQGLTEISPDWQVTGLSSGEEALASLSRQSCDVIVSDLAMPRMDGIKLLTEVMQRFPGVVRIAISGHTDFKATLKLVGPAHRYLAKPCEIRQLKALIQEALELRDQLSNARLKRLVSQMHSLPSIPSLYMELLEALRGQEPPAQKIAQIISRDLGMCAKLLQLVNSAFFGLSQQITNPTEAVIYLGVETVKALVLSLQIFTIYERVKIEHFSFEDLWAHSWMTAILARRIAEREGMDMEAIDGAFVAGLLHDVGKLVLGHGMPLGFRQVMSLHRDKAMPCHEAESLVFGSTHSEVGAYLLGLWGVPDQVVEAVALHHSPGECQAAQFNVVGAVHVADALVHEHQQADSLPPVALMDTSYLQQLNLTDRIDTWRNLMECDQLCET